MLRTLLKSVREYKGKAVMTPIFVAGEVICEAAIPFVIAGLVNDIRAGVGINVIVSYGWKLLLLAFISLIFGWLAGLTCATAACGFGKNLRHDVFYKVEDFSFQNIDHFSSASLVTRLTTDIQNVQMTFMMIIRTAVRAPLNLIFSFLMAYLMGGRTALIFLVVIPLLAIGLGCVIKAALPLYRKAFPMYDALNESVEENVNGIRVVKSFVREEHENKKFDCASENVQKLFTKAERIVALNNPMMQMCMYIVMLFVLWFGSKTIIVSGGTELNVGQFSTLLTYSFQILSSLMMLSMIFVMITLSLESGERLAEVLNEESTVTSPSDPVMEVKDGSIDFDHVAFKYNKMADRHVLDHIDLHIKSGETIGIIGGTGSSKSSLVQLIPRLYDVTEGCVRVGKEDVRNYDLKVLRDAVAMVLQKNVLFSGTIAENLRWGNKEASDEELRQACHMACADEFIDLMPDGYNTKIEQGGTNVSGGQKQRLCIARALLKKPKILIMDDSTSAVDTKTDALIRKAMKEYIPETTKIIIAQRTSSVEDADHIIVLDDGKIDAIGTSEELLRTNRIYREVYTSQNKAGTEDVPEQEEEHA